MLHALAHLALPPWNCASCNKPMLLLLVLTAAVGRELQGCFATVLGLARAPSCGHSHACRVLGFPWLLVQWLLPIPEGSSVLSQAVACLQTPSRSCPTHDRTADCTYRGKGLHLLLFLLMCKLCNTTTARFDQCAGDAPELSRAVFVDVARASSSSLSLHPMQTRLEQIPASLAVANATRKVAAHACCEASPGCSEVCQ